MFARKLNGTAQETAAMVGISRQAAASVTGRPMLKLPPAAVSRRKPRKEQLIQFLIIILSVCAITTLILLELCNTTNSLPPEGTNRISHILTQTQMENIELEMKMREMRVMDQCWKSDNFKIKITPLKTRLRTVVRKLLIDKEHKLAWCPTYKAGSTTWMTIFATIGGVLTPENRLNVTKGLIQINHLARMAYPEATNINTTVKAISEMTRFMIVRHPFERILSAYRDKLEHRENQEFYYRRYGRQMVKSQREANSTFANRPEPTFVEFLKYLVQTRIFDEHWRPFTAECAPCEMNYQIILKMESLEEEQLFLATKLNLLDYLFALNSTGWLLLNTNPNGRTEHKYAEQYYREVPKKLLQQVYMLYEEDFRLFDYSPKKYFNFATDNTQQEAAESFG